jgi:hypothetical protein
VAFSPTTADDFAIEALARRSIEVLPAGQWPSLYDDFTQEFQTRCPRDAFIAGGEQNATELGAQLHLLGYKRLEDVVYTGDAATAVIVGTEGCAAFNRLSDGDGASPQQ